MEAHLNGTSLFYETHGSGTPLLCMHGGLGLDHSCFPASLNALADQATLIYYDHRGNGRSERPASFADVTHATWAADADALRAHLGHEQVVLFGHSYGSFLALEYALAYPERLAGLVLCCGAPVIDYFDVINANAAARGTPDQLAALGEVFGRPMADDDDWRALWGRLAPLYFNRYDPELGAAMDASTHYSAAAWNHCNANCLPKFNVLDRLGEISAPTLILSGTHDWITPPKQGGQRLHAGIGGSTYVEFSESGHWPFIEERERFLQVLRGWLSAR